MPLYRLPTYPLKMDVSIRLEAPLAVSETGWELRDKETGVQILDNLPFFPSGVLNIASALEAIRKVAESNNPAVRFIEVDGVRIWERRK